MEIEKRFLVIMANIFEQPTPIKACDVLSEAEELREAIERKSHTRAIVVDLMEWCKEDGRDESEKIWESSSNVCW
jgi:hypothetical protein